MNDQFILSEAQRFRIYTNLDTKRTGLVFGKSPIAGGSFDDSVNSFFL